VYFNYSGACENVRRSAPYTLWNSFPLIRADEPADKPFLLRVPYRSDLRVRYLCISSLPLPARLNTLEGD
jgi:hypothetical protein